MAKYEYHGISGLKNIAAYTGIPFSTLQARINKSGMNIEQAVMFRPHVISYNGIQGIDAIAHANGISPMTLRHRIYNKKMMIEEAIKYQPSTSQQFIGVRHPDISDVWKLALGMRIEK
ncbi:hypothetical protein RND59_05590 [Vibrio ruber]|uniref:hypothetical protein n=1 Tax=Vibrio ruber TaxID=184755 RepID=UPI002892C4EB|nr:hypothetical protein [Vibrio ruber]WNJ96569.1 hypothetical protein RND59_05590 [Vibrio ruber]